MTYNNNENKQSKIITFVAISVIRHSISEDDK